jgi:hypothetical protein
MPTKMVDAMKTRKRKAWHMFSVASASGEELSMWNSMDFLMNIRQVGCNKEHTPTRNFRIIKNWVTNVLKTSRVQKRIPC